MCKSVRGAAYFGSSIHLAFSFVFLFWFVFDTLISEININLWRCDPPEQKFSQLNPLAHYLNLLFKLLYFTGLSVTGIYIFRGVERERPQLLKYATLAFVIIQILGIIFFPIFFSIQWNTEPDEGPKAESLQSLFPAQLVGEEPQLPPCATKCILAKPVEEQVEVTPIVSENVLVAPDVNETTTTTPLPPPPPPPIMNDSATTTPPTTTTTTTQVPPLPPPCIGPDCPQNRPPAPPQARRLPHNQLVKLVLQMCFAITNGLLSIAYLVVLALYMVKL